jgi:SAM-dependent methyltransferase
MVDKSWQMAGGPGHPLYEFYDWLRRGLNQRITSRLARLGVDRPGVVVEAGSGTGYASGLFAHEANVTLSVAVDYDFEALVEGRRDNPALCAVVADVHHLPFKTGSVQLVWNSSTIEHLDDQRAVTAEMARIVRPAGRIFIGVPYKWGPLFFQRWLPNTALGIWLGTVYARQDIESWQRAASCEPFDSWRYFLWFFVGVIGVKK